MMRFVGKLAAKVLRRPADKLCEGTELEMKTGLILGVVVGVPMFLMLKTLSEFAGL